MRWYNGWDGVNDVDDGLLLWLQMVIYMMIFIVPRTYVYIYIYIYILGTMSSFREGNPCILSAKKKHLPGARKKSKIPPSPCPQQSTSILAPPGQRFVPCDFWKMAMIWAKMVMKKMLHTMTVQVPKSSDFSHSFGTYESATRVTVIFDTLAIKRSKKTSCISLHWTHI